jgi:hypothetical protein
VQFSVAAVSASRAAAVVHTPYLFSPSRAFLSPAQSGAALTHFVSRLRPTTDGACPPEKDEEEEDNEEEEEEDDVT